MDKNYNETLNKYNYLLKNDEGSFTDIVYLYHIYMIKIKQRKLDKENNNNSNNNKNNKTEDKELIELEKKVLNLFYEDLSVENIKKYPPSFFYCLSRLFRNNSIKTKDLILEYIFLNRTLNAKIMETQNSLDLIFEEKYLKEKAKKKSYRKKQRRKF